MGKVLLTPDYIFESSWEVCNKVGGIYTVLSTRAKTLQDAMKDHIFFIGPDFWQQKLDDETEMKESPYFREDKALFADWQWEAKERGLNLRVGRWTIPGEPIAILVDFKPFFEKKNGLAAIVMFSLISPIRLRPYVFLSSDIYASLLLTASFTVLRCTSLPLIRMVPEIFCP